MPKDVFPQIGPIAYEGPDSKNPLAFKHYNPTELVEGQPLLGAVLIVMALLVGPGGHALLSEDDSSASKH